jgi:hypothetical protein
MKHTRIVGVVITVIGILIVAIPWLILPVCGQVVAAQSPKNSTGVHGCDNTLIAETVIGCITILAGLMAAFIPKKKMILGVSLLTIVLAALVILFPTEITGVCKIPTMPCVYGTLPGLVVIGIGLALTGVSGFVISRKM